ncbi:hypothetical protein ABPG75_007309 [Micractinium tetrahymenae]
MAAAAAAAALLPPLLLLLSAAHATAAIPYIHDDLLWTKQNWGEYRLPFPWAAVLKERDAESTRVLQGPLRGFAAHSLNGPVLDSGALSTLVHEDARRPPVGVAQQNSLEISLLDETASTEAAAGVASCKVCGSLVKLLWGGLTHWVNVRQQVPSKKRIAAYAAQLCEYEVPNDVLQGWVLLRAKVQAGEGLPFAIEGQAGASQQGHEFYLLSQRTKQHATPSEIDSVRKACHALLREDDVGTDAKRHLLQLAASMLHQYYHQLAKRLNPSTAASVWDAAEPVDDGPQAERACYNRHPQCELWRQKGECESNPKYMVGDPGAEGWCRRACGACTAEQEPHSLGAEDAQKMADAASSALAVLQSQACLSAAPCKWAAGAGMQQLLSKAKRSAGGQSSEAARVLDDAAYISGPVMSRQQQLEAALDPDRLKETKPMLVRPLADAIVPEKKLGKLTVRKEAEPEGAPAVLAKELKDKCLYVNTGWWMYQLCYKRHITQFHMTEKLEVDWLISLGKYEGANWTLGIAEETGLYPHTTKVPYAAHSFGEGNHCDLDEEDPSTGQKRAILRRTELRLMCSPDQDAHITVSEPEQCAYVLELYMPQLCKVEGYSPELPPGMADALDAAWNGGAGGGGAEEPAGVAVAPRTSRLAEQQAARRAAAAAARRRKEEEDDPYVDPDQLEEEEGEEEEGDEETRDEL